MSRYTTSRRKTTRVHTAAEILRIVNEVKAGASVVEVCREYGVPDEAAFEVYKARAETIEVQRELGQQREENTKLRRLLIDAMHIISDDTFHEITRGR